MLNLIDAFRDWVRSVLANFHSMYLGYVTPEMFGAKGDGVTDDTTAVNNAISAAATQGTYVKFLPKTYIVNNMTITSNMVLIGEDTVITTDENKTAKIIYEWKNDILVDGITFNNFSEMNLKYSRRLTFQNCKFLNYDTQVFSLQWVQKINFKNCLFDNIGSKITDPSNSGKAMEILGRQDDVANKNTKIINIEGCEFSRIYGGKAIKVYGEVSDVRIVSNTFHDLTYGAIGFWSHACTEDSFNIISDNKMYNIGTFDVAPGDTNGQTSASGATAIYAYGRTKDADGVSVVENHLNIICTRNVMQNLVENAIEGAFKEISYNVIDTTGLDVGRVAGKGGIYVPYEVQNVHHNTITNCLNGGRGIFVHSNYDSHHTQDVKVCDNHITRCASNSIRVQGYIDGITILDNEVDGVIELVPNNDYPNFQKFYYRQPNMFVCYKRVRYDEGLVDIEGDYSKANGWNMTGNITTNADGNMVIPPNSSISQKFERNTVNLKAGERVHCVVTITYSLHDIIGTGGVMELKINDDGSSRSKGTLNGIYATSEDVPTEKEFFTRNYIFSTDSTSKEITFRLKNVFSGTGNLEIKNIQVKMVKGINSISTLSDVVETPIDFTTWEE